MGFLTGGPYYDMIGRTGNNVGRRRKGKNTFSMRPAKSHKPPTVLQGNQRLRFGLMTNWLKKVVPILDIGFQHYEGEGSAYTAAVSYNLEHAVTGVSPNFTVNYATAQFSQGVLKKPSQVSVVAAADALVTYNWVNIAGAVNSSMTDQIGVVVYNPDKAEFVMLLNVALRSAQEYELQLPLDWDQDVVHSWLIAVSADGKAVSDTAYVGQVTVIA